MLTSDGWQPIVRVGHIEGAGGGYRVSGLQGRMIKLAKQSQSPFCALLCPTFCSGPSMERNTTVTMPELMREAVPFQLNIIIFRNPVDRYYSAYYYYRCASIYLYRIWDHSGLPCLYTRIAFA